MLNLLIADDHSIVRRGLRQIHEETPDIQVSGAAANGREVMEKVRARSWDALVLDLAMPGASGLDVLKQVKEHSPSLPVLILSMHEQDQYAGRALKAGASGYLPKESAPEELVNAIRRICAGGKYLTVEQVLKLGCLSQNADEQLPHEKLSDREFQVLRLIASGKAVSQIGVELKLSVKTVSTYRMRLLEKMRLKNNAELTHYGVKNGLV